MRTVAVLPVKSFSRAKQRLGRAIADRPALAEAMVGDVLEALGDVRGLEGGVVVAADDRVGELTAGGRSVALELIHDPVEAGQSPAAARGVRAAIARGAERVLLVPGDC